VGGNIGKLYAELAEAVEPRVIQALRATGASRWAIFLHAVLPQVGRQWTGYALFCLECNIRIGTILGVVGAGGLGSEIALSLRYFQYDKLATTLLAVLAFVVALELVSAQLRQRRLRWALSLAAIGTAWALHQLDIPWADLWSSQAPPLLTFDNLVLDAPFVQTVSAQIGETLMMAWVATLASAGLAFVLSPIAASHLIAAVQASAEVGQPCHAARHPRDPGVDARARVCCVGGWRPSGGHHGHRRAQHRRHGALVCRRV
jgi:phosphonate transport system permease protein